MSVPLTWKALILTASTRTQGKRSGDFARATTGEVLALDLVCTNHGIDHACGCQRAYVGVVSGKRTTTAVVTRTLLTYARYTELVIGNYTAMGLSDPDAGQWGREDAEDLSRLAGHYQPGTVLGRRAEEIIRRAQPAPTLDTVERIEHLRFLALTVSVDQAHAALTDTARLTAREGEVPVMIDLTGVTRRVPARPREGVASVRAEVAEIIIAWLNDRHRESPGRAPLALWNNGFPAVWHLAGNPDLVPSNVSADTDGRYRLDDRWVTHQHEVTNPHNQHRC